MVIEWLEARWVVPATRMCKIRNLYKNFVSKPEGTAPIKRINVSNGIILEMILKKQSVQVRIEFTWLSIRKSGGLCDFCDNETAQ
jgi:hypothetical protein